MKFYDRTAPTSTSAGASGWSRNFERMAAKTSAPSSFIANAHNELYAFYTGKGDRLNKNSEANSPHTPLNPLLAGAPPETPRGSSQRFSRPLSMK